MNETLEQQRERLIAHMQSALALSPQQVARVRELFQRSSVLSQGNPRISMHPLGRAECRAQVAERPLVPGDAECGAPYMAALYPRDKGGPDTARACIDQFEFPNIPCEYPVVHVSAREAAQLCEAVGKRMCDACLLEFALQYRHESQHYTGSNAGDAGEDVRNEPYVGDDFIFDGALSERTENWYFAQRASLLWFLPQRSSYSAGAAFDLHARFTRWQLVHPFASLYGEYRFGSELNGRDFPDAHRLRVLFGGALPSALGDIMVYGFADTGHRYGIRGLTNEATLGLGVRLALGSHPGL